MDPRGGVDSQGAPEPTDEDATLVASIRAGDPGAFRTLFDSYYDRLVGFAASFVPSMDTAHDVVEEVFLTLWRTRTTWAPRGVKVYLYAAVRHRAFNANRSGWRELSLAGFDEEHAWESLVDHSPDLDEQLDAEAHMNRLRAVLRRLPARQRAVVTLRWEEGLSYAEIAQALGISEGAAQVHVSRTLKILKTLFSSDLR